MKRLLFLAVLVTGIVLLVFGFNASESFASEVSETFQGTPTDRSLWLIIGGALLTIVGLGGLVRGGRSA